MSDPRRVLLLYAASGENATFSYQHTWPAQFQHHPRFVCTPINLGGLGVAGRLVAQARVRAWQGDAIVLLHSVFSNGCFLAGRLFDAVRQLPQPKAFFIGNEYKLMPEKMRFCEELGLDLLVSQSSSPAVHQLYVDRLGCVVVGIPNSGLDPHLFRSTTAPDDRPIDLGYRADDAPWYLGHQERRSIAEYFQTRAQGLGLSVDVSLAPADRFDVPGWAAFLNRCRGQLGTEAGGDFFDLTDRSRTAVNALLDARPSATFDEVWTQCFADYDNPTPLRIISSRHVEAAGTKTVQVLFEGHYDGYFEPDVHYISLRKDFADANEAIAKLRDRSFCRIVADRAHARVHEELTYDRLIGRFADALENVL